MKSILAPVLESANYLIQSINLFYDFVNMPETNGATIATIEDERGAYNGTGVNSPTCEVLSFNGDSIKSYKDETNKAFTLSSPAQDLFNHSLEVWAILSSTDGHQTASAIQICGSRTADTNRQFSLFIGGSTSAVPGSLIMTYGYTGIRTIWRTLAAVVPAGSVPITLLRLRLNFEGDVVRMFVNGEEQTMTVQEGLIANIDPALYDNTANMHVGTINANGTLSSNAAASNFYKFLIAFRLRGSTGGSNYIQEKLVESALMKDILSHYTQWQNELGVTPANIASKRADMITYMFNGNGLPANATPAGSTIGYSGLMHGVDSTSVVGDSSIDRRRFEVVDGDAATWTYYTYFIHNSTPTEKWLIEHRGHGSEGPATHLTTINRALSEGYNVIFCAMPVADPDTDGQNTTTNPLVGTHGHEQLYADGVDTVSYNALELFFSSQIQAINFLFANYTVESLYAMGLSGGGYTVSMLGAIDTRIEKTSAHRGFMPRSAKYYPFFKSGFEPDFEQGGANGLQANCGPRVYQFFTDHPQLEIMAMCTDGGRVYGTITHTNDSSIFYGYTWLAWKDAMKTKALEMGGRYFQYLNQTAGESLHSYQPTELDRVFYEFNL